MLFSRIRFRNSSDEDHDLCNTTLPPTGVVVGRGRGERGWGVVLEGGTQYIASIPSLERVYVMYPTRINACNAFRVTNHTHFCDKRSKMRVN